MANVLSKLNADANCEGRDILVRPSPAIPETPAARPCNKKVGAQAKRNRETVTFGPGLEPVVDWTETTSDASSPPVAVCVKVLSGVRPQVLLLHPGFGEEKQSPQPVAFAREHWAEWQRAGRYVDDT